jgi:hypothetical protein
MTCHRSQVGNVMLHHPAIQPLRYTRRQTVPAGTPLGNGIAATNCAAACQAAPANSYMCICYSMVAQYVGIRSCIPVLLWCCRTGLCMRYGCFRCIPAELARTQSSLRSSTLPQRLHQSNLGNRTKVKTRNHGEYSTVRDPKQPCTAMYRLAKVSSEQEVQQPQSKSTQHSFLTATASSLL